MVQFEQNLCLSDNLHDHKLMAIFEWFLKILTRVDVDSGNQKEIVQPAVISNFAVLKYSIIIV